MLTMEYSTTSLMQENVCITVKIYDACGRLVDQLHKNADQAAKTTLVWHGEDERGRKVSDGVYFVTFATNGFTTTKKIVLLR
jgi:flagellar hook assembly protein FlgD